MRILSFLCFAYLLSPGIFAQDTPQAGFLQMVNLVSLDKPTYIEIAGLPMSGGEPVAAGESSGVVALIPNEYRFSIANEEAKPKSAGGEVTVENGKSVVIVFFDEEKEYRDGSKEIKLRYTVLKELAGKPEAKLSLVSLSVRDSLPVHVGTEPVTLSERKAYAHPVALKDKVEIKYEGKPVGEVEIEKSVHYIAFLYDDPETGTPGLSVIQEEKLEYQAPIDEDEEESDQKEDE